MLVGVVVSMGAMAQIPLRIMSFNLRTGDADDKDNSWLHRKDIVVNVIKKHAPDVVGTQECVDYQAAYLAENLNNYAWYGLGREVGGKGEMMAVFYRKDSLKLLDVNYFWLSETPEVVGSKSWGAACTRMVSQARFKHVKSGKIINYFNTHFDHYSEKARHEAAQLLLARMRKILKNKIVVLTGDFNAVAEKSEAWKVLTEGGLSDTWLSASHKKGPAYTFGEWKAPVPEKPDGRIDWILYSGPIKGQSIETLTDTQNGRYPSDHYPVFAVLNIQ